MEPIPFTHRYGSKTNPVSNCVVSNHAWPPPTTMVERRQTSSNERVQLLPFVYSNKITRLF